MYFEQTSVPIWRVIGECKRMITVVLCPPQPCIALYLFPPLHCVCVYISGQSRLGLSPSLCEGAAVLILRKFVLPKEMRHWRLVKVNLTLTIKKITIMPFLHTVCLFWKVFHSFFTFMHSPSLTHTHKHTHTVTHIPPSTHHLSPSGGTPQRPWDPVRCQTLNMAFLGSHCYGYL